MTIYLPQKRFFKIIATITILSSLLILNGCRSKDNAMEANADDISQDHAYEKSPLALGQSHLLDSQVDSAAEWQSWHKDLFDKPTTRGELFSPSSAQAQIPTC